MGSENPIQGSGGSGGGGSSTSKFILGQQMEDVLADDTTEYGGFMSRNSFSGSAAGREFTSPTAFTLKNLVVNVRTNSGNTVNQVAMLQINGMDTALTITIPFNTDGIFTVTADESVAKDDVLRLKVTNVTNTGTFTITSYSCECEM